MSWRASNSLRVVYTTEPRNTQTVAGGKGMEFPQCKDLKARFNACSEVNCSGCFFLFSLLFTHSWHHVFPSIGSEEGYLGFRIER